MLASRRPLGNVGQGVSVLAPVLGGTCPVRPRYVPWRLSWERRAVKRPCIATLQGVMLDRLEAGLPPFPELHIVHRVLRHSPAVQGAEDRRERRLGRKKTSITRQAARQILDGHVSLIEL